jgi:RimJ/RimL family protein N-acetyltransferase
VITARLWRSPPRRASARGRQPNGWARTCRAPPRRRPWTSRARGSQDCLLRMIERVEVTPRLSVPAAGIRAGNVWLRLPQLEDVDGLVPAFSDPELREAGNLPAFDRDELVANLGELPKLAETGRLLALAALDANSSKVIGGGTLHHLDADRRIVEIGYFVLPHARGRGAATTIARALAEHAFSLGDRARRRLCQRRQHCLRARPRARRVHARGRRSLDAEAGRPTRRQDAVLAAFGRMS